MFVPRVKYLSLIINQPLFGLFYHHAEVEITRDQLVRARGQSEYVEMCAISAAIKCVRDAQAAGTI